MNGNDRLGDCVIASRGNQTLYFKYAETSKLITISETEIENEYFHETGGPDEGLVITESLNAWRKGWKAGGKTLTIKAWAEINRKNPLEVCSTIFADLGCQIGVELPMCAQAETDAGKPWAQTTGRGATPGSWGGHCVPLVGYDAKYFYCITWARIQAMTRAWFKKYCSEAYAVIDAIDTAKKRRLIDSAALASHLSSLN